MSKKEFVIPSSQNDLDKIKRVLKTVSDCYYRVEAERDLIKDEIGVLVEEFEIPRSVLNKMARTYHRQNINDIVDETEEFAALYEKVLGE